MKALFSDVHWGRVLLTGVLLVILDVILNTVLLLLATHIWSQSDQAQIAIQVSSWSSYILVILLTVGGAVWVARKVEREAPLHGLLVGLVVALILLILSVGFGSPLLMALLTFDLNLAAGWLGGVLGSRGRKKP
jgi:putative membrane protein (TIGR04086 family)